MSSSCVTESFLYRSLNRPEICDQISRIDPKSELGCFLCWLLLLKYSVNQGPSLPPGRMVCPPDAVLCYAVLQMEANGPAMPWRSFNFDQVTSDREERWGAIWQQKRRTEDGWEANFAPTGTDSPVPTLRTIENRRGWSDKEELWIGAAVRILVPHTGNFREFYNQGS